MFEFAAPVAPEVFWGSLLLQAGVLALVGVFVAWRLRRLEPASGRPWERRGHLALPVFLVVLFLTIDACNFRDGPTAYLLDDDSVTVRTRSRTVEFPLAWFDRVGRDDDGYWRRAYSPYYFVQMQGRSQRGPFGAVGVTRPPERPWVNVYVTDPDRVVVLGDRVNLLVSPDDPERFIREVRRRMPGISAGDAPAPDG